jgi:hypothetical protein
MASEDSLLSDGGKTGLHTDAKSNYTAIKQAYNSPSQASLVHRNISVL